MVHRVISSSPDHRSAVFYTLSFPSCFILWWYCGFDEQFWCLNSGTGMKNTLKLPVLCHNTKELTVTKTNTVPGAVWKLAGVFTFGLHVRKWIYFIDIPSTFMCQSKFCVRAFYKTQKVAQSVRSEATSCLLEESFWRSTPPASEPTDGGNNSWLLSGDFSVMFMIRFTG